VTELDFKKYKRFFTFGCSFTHHIYPTWANILANEMPDAEFYNFGRSGAGNLYISAKISEANNSLKFTKDDLVMVMWSSFSREDRWINGLWKTQGNVYNNDYYDEDFCRKYVDPIGYIIRDLALISLTKGYLDSLGIDYRFMMSYDINFLEFKSGLFFKNDNHSKMIDIINKNYEDIIKSIPVCLSKYIVHEGISYILENGEQRTDTHPTPLIYYNFLKDHEFFLTEKSERYVSNCMEKISKCPSRELLLKAFDHEVHQVTKNNHKFII